MKKVHINPYYRAKRDPVTGKKDMPVFDFALIELWKDLKFGEGVQQNRGQIFMVVFWYK